MLTHILPLLKGKNKLKPTLNYISPFKKNPKTKFSVQIVQENLCG